MFASSPGPLNNNDVEKGELYEDDFEQDSTSEDVPKKDSNIIEENKTVKDENEKEVSPTGIEKGQREIESPGREKSGEVSDNESELDADAYNFTEDQKRAMMELLVQKQEDTDFLDEEPPEYNVKGRLEQLNAELASEPTPQEGERELKVGFKPEIVDLVAPPPDFSDDESQPNSARGEPLAAGTEPKPDDKPQAVVEADSGKPDSEKSVSQSQEKTERQFVVERDGNFEVLNADEMTASERALYIPEKQDEEKSTEKEEEQKSSETKQSHDANMSTSSNTNEPEKVPKPPARPRPNTATSTGPRRNLRPAQSPRPKSASHTGGSNSSLNNFSYISPYAMSPEQKEHSKEATRKAEDERKERERRKQEEAAQRHQENERSFQAWLKAKREENKKKNDNEDRQQSEQERLMKMAGMVGHSESAFETYDIIYPYLLKEKDPREDNNEAYRTWLKEKRTQGKKDKLLKRRQQQEMMEAYYIRPREECEQAFREWLRKKNSDLRRQHEMERQRNKMYRVQVKRSKKTQALLKAMKESQAFRYVDYYGYRY